MGPLPRTAAQQAGAFLAAVLAASATGAGSPPAPGLRPGDILGPATCARARDYLLPEVLVHYQRGEYVNRIAAWPDGLVRWSPEFLAATTRNRGRFTVSSAGTIIDKATGKQPASIYGFPFPAIDPRDPRVAVKILWNYYYQYWNNGNSHHLTDLEWIGRGGVERRVRVEVRYLYYDGQPPELIPKDNPNNLLSQFLSMVTRPADLHGTAALSWRYRDAERRDSNWAYVPALRRVRQVSPTNRSDGFLGSDMSQDDGPFFDGKPEDFTWKLSGQVDLYRLADPYSLRGEVSFSSLPGGGWRVGHPRVPYIRYQDPDATGLPWAPSANVMVRRPFWVIEGVPKDRYYLFGKIQLYIDRENYRGGWNRKFDWKGRLRNSLSSSISANASPDSRTYIWVAPVGFQFSENVPLGRATVAGLPPAGVPDPPTDFRIPADPAFFSYETLTRLGK